LAKDQGETPMTKAQVAVPLDIPDVYVLKTEMNKDGELIITIESTKVGTTCRVCGRWISKSHGQADWVTVRHLPVFGRPTYLRYRPHRYECQECEDHPTTVQKLDWHDPYSRCSFGDEEHLLLQLVGSTVSDVSIKERIAYDAVRGTLERRIETEVDWSKFTELEVLGLDEIALKKGQRDYVTIVTARLQGERIVLLGVLPDRQKDGVVAVLRSIPQRLRMTIRRLWCDMYEGYSEAVRAELPQAQLVIDRFHVSHHYHQAADQLRQTELKRLKKELPAEAYPELNGNMWAFR
jgi:transposase